MATPFAATFPPAKAPKPGLNIYGCLAVNPYKLTIAAEELGIPYNYVDLDVVAGDSHSDWYRALNPDGKVPALVHVKDDKGSVVTVFETGACLLYMASTFDPHHRLSYPFGTPEFWKQQSWLTWQVACLGPMMGQAVYFNRYALEPVPYAAHRYTAEARRLHSVLDKHLATQPYVAGDRLTVADVAIFIFTHGARWCGIDLAEFPHVKEYHGRLAQRPAFVRGLSVPTPFAFSDETVLKTEGPEFELLWNLRKMGSVAIKGFTDAWWGGTVPPVPSDHANLDAR